MVYYVIFLLVLYIIYQAHEIGILRRQVQWWMDHSEELNDSLMRTIDIYLHWEEE